MNTQVAIGSLYITANAQNQLDKQSITDCLRKHINGDWGDLDKQDKETNNLALQTDERILSAYHDTKGKKFYIITEADRSITTILLSDDY